MGVCACCFRDALVERSARQTLYHRLTWSMTLEENSYNAASLAAETHGHQTFSDVKAPGAVNRAAQRALLFHRHVNKQHRASSWW